MFIDTLIIGNGFAGRTVASGLQGECLIVERGEKFNIFERRQRFMQMDKTNRHDALIRRSYESKHSFNVPEQMPKDCGSEYILVDGGCSNHWGGLSFRLSENVFENRAGNFPGLLATRIWRLTIAGQKPCFASAPTRVTLMGATPGLISKDLTSGIRRSVSISQAHTSALRRTTCQEKP